MMNHWWQVPLYVTVRGLTTSPMPCGSQTIQIDFDFSEHVLRLQSSSGEIRTIPLAGHSVATFYRDLMEAVHVLKADTKIWTVPVEVEEQIPFEQDTKHASYDPDYAHLFWQVLLQVDRVMKVFRGRFCGKASPVHFFWGSFDMATTRFSGRDAPLKQSAYHVATYVMQESYCPFFKRRTRLAQTWLAGIVIGLNAVFSSRRFHLPDDLIGTVRWYTRVRIVPGWSVPCGLGEGPG